MTGLKSVKYIQLDDIKGCLYAAGNRSLLIPVTFVSLINTNFTRLLGEEGNQLLTYRLGETLGEGYGDTLMKILQKENIELDKETLIREIYHAISMEAGWGKIEIVELDLEKKIILIRITNSPSGELIPGTQYSLERGILAGCFKGITGQQIYFGVQKEEKEAKAVILEALEEIPQEILTAEKTILLSRQELERMNKLMIGRELKMRELKKEIERLKSQQNA